MPVPFRVDAQFAKAEERDGELYLTLVASDTGPDRSKGVDKQGVWVAEKVNPAFLTKMVQQARREAEGHPHPLVLNSAHSDSMGFGEAVGHDDDAAREHKTRTGYDAFAPVFKLDSGDPKAVRLFKEVQSGSCSKQASIGGFTAQARKTYDSQLGGFVKELMDGYLHEVTVTFPNAAANPRTGFASAIAKSIDWESEDIPFVDEEGNEFTKEVAVANGLLREEEMDNELTEKAGTSEGVRRGWESRRMGQMGRKVGKEEHQAARQRPMEISKFRGTAGDVYAARHVSPHTEFAHETYGHKSEEQARAALHHKIAQAIAAGIEPYEYKTEKTSVDTGGISMLAERDLAVKGGKKMAEEVKKESESGNGSEPKTKVLQLESGEETVKVTVDADDEEKFLALLGNLQKGGEEKDARTLYQRELDASMSSPAAEFLRECLAEPCNKIVTIADFDGLQKEQRDAALQAPTEALLVELYDFAFAKSKVAQDTIYTILQESLPEEEAGRLMTLLDERVSKMHEGCAHDYGDGDKCKNCGALKKSAEDAEEEGEPTAKAADKSAETDKQSRDKSDDAEGIAAGAKDGGKKPSVADASAQADAQSAEGTAALPAAVHSKEGVGADAGTVEQDKSSGGSNAQTPADASAAAARQSTSGRATMKKCLNCAEEHAEPVEACQKCGFKAADEPRLRKLLVETAKRRGVDVAELEAALTAA